METNFNSNIKDVKRLLYVKRFQYVDHLLWQQVCTDAAMKWEFFTLWTANVYATRVAYLSRARQLWLQFFEYSLQCALLVVEFIWLNIKSGAFSWLFSFIIYDLGHIWLVSINLIQLKCLYYHWRWFAVVFRSGKQFDVMVTSARV